MGARLIRDLNPAGSSSPESIISIDGLLFFTADLGAGTTIEPPTDEEASDSDENATEESDENNDTAADNTALNESNNANQGQALGQGIALLKSDGTAEGTKVLKEFQSINDLVEVNGELYFIADDGSGPDATGGNRLWRSDGTARGTVLVKDLYPGADPSFPQDLFEIDGVLFYSAIDGAGDDGKYPYVNGYEVWRREGNGVGSRFFRNLIPDKIITEIDVTEKEEKVLDEDGIPVKVPTGENGDLEELIRTVYTAEVSTTTFENDSFPQDFVGINGNYFFTAQSSSLYSLEASTSDTLIGGLELWFSDGTEAGTSPININQNDYTFYEPEEGDYEPATIVDEQDFGFKQRSASSFPRELTEFEDNLVLVANDGISGFELWTVTDNGENPRIIADLSEGNTSSSPEELTVAGNRLYFTANDNSGRKLWSISNNLDKPTLVKGAGDDPKQLTNIDGKLYFSAKSELGRELWVADGTNANLVEDINQGTGSSSPANFTAIENQHKGNIETQLFFTADDGERGIELWSLDLAKNSSKPQRYDDILDGPTSSEPRQLINAEQRLYFTADDGESGRELWALGVTIQGPSGSTDGESTAAVQVEEQTKKVFEYSSDSYVAWSLNGGDDSDLFTINKKGWLKFNEEPYYDSPVDSNRDNIYQVRIRAKDQRLGTTSDQLVDIEVTQLNGGTDQGNGTDGDGENNSDGEGNLLTSRMVKNINSGQKSSNPSHLTSHIDEALLFAADNDKKGIELWSSKGDKKTTSLLKDIKKGSEGSNPSEFTTHDSLAYFSADDGKKGQELWVTNGKRSGTKLASDINPGAAGSFPSDFLFVDQRLFFGANDGQHGRELWSYSTKHQTSSLVLDIQTKANIGSNPGELTNFNGQIMFAADDQIYGRELWISDGTGPGTRLLDDLNPGGLSSNPSHLCVLNGKLYFTAESYLLGGRQIFRLDNQNNDGATAIVLKDGDNSGIEPSDLHSSSDQLLFTAETTFEPTPEQTPSAPSSDESTDSGSTPSENTDTPDAEEIKNNLGRELWVSNGEADGHQLLKDIAPGAGSSNPRGFHTIGSKTYFSADDGVNGEELWVTDGTESGTYLVSDINKGSGDSSPRSINDLDGNIYFSAKTDQYGRELWRLDDTQKKASRIVSSGAGKKKLRALDGNANEFRFELEGQFGKRQADRITGFDQTEGDQLALGRDVFDGLTDIDLVTVTSKTQLATQSNNSTALIYFEPRGKLYFNQNGDASGYGEDGGLFAILKGGPDLSESAFRIL